MYDSDPDLEEFYSRICTAADKITSDYAIIFVNDGSPGNSLDIAVSLLEKCSRVRIINLSRNFAHHKAIMFSERLYCNPGSVWQPRDGDARAAFAVITGVEIHLRRVEYDIDEIALRMKKSGFDSYFYSNLYQGARIGGLLSNVREKSSRQV